MKDMLTTKPAVLLKLESFRSLFLVFGAAIVDPFALGAFQLNILAHLLISFVVEKAPDRF